MPAIGPLVAGPGLLAQRLVLRLFRAESRRESPSCPESSVPVDPTPLTPQTAERNIRYNVQHGVASVLPANLAVPFFGILALKMGASNFQIALLSSAPAIMSLLVMIPGAIYVDRFSLKKRVTTMFFWANRVFYLLLACVPFFTEDRRAAALVVAVALMNLPGAIGNVAWQSFISRVIPSSRRAQAFAHRNRWMNVVGTVAVVIAGRALDIMRFPLGYQVMFLVAFVAAMVEIRIFQRIEEPEAPPGGNSGAATSAGSGTPSRAGPNGLRRRLIDLPGSVRWAWRDILSHPRFVRFTLAAVVFYFMWQIAWPLFTLYQVKELGANNLWVSLLTLANSSGALFGYGLWAKVADRRGHLGSLCLASTGMFLVPLFYALLHSLVALAILNLAVGVIFSGVILGLFNALLESVPEERTTTYIAYYNTAITLTTVFAPLVGVGLLKLTGFFWAFLICAVGRVLGSYCFYLVLWSRRREEARPTFVTAAGPPA